jgi:predicted NAD/FAD-dependent oxidoreductase
VAVQVLDRGRAGGGRLASKTLSGRRVDHGASYCTATDERFVALVDDWVSRGLARPWTDTFHVASPSASARPSRVPVRYGATPRAAHPRGGPPRRRAGAAGDHRQHRRSRPDRRRHGVRRGRAGHARPPAARLLSAELAAEVAAVAARTWEPVLALAAGWDERHWDPSFDGCFVDGSAVLGWIADDGRRRGDGAPVLVAHSTSSFAAAHLEDPQAATQAMVEATAAVLGVTPPPEWSLVQRWTYARPAGPRDAPFHLGPARVGLCGDGWGSPKVETAYLSGRVLGEQLAEELTGRSARS